MKYPNLLPRIYCSVLLVLRVFLFSAQGQDVFIQHGQASFYADRFQGRLTASGERYDASAMTAAHLTLPFGTLVKVTNNANNHSVMVRINDRGPFVEGRIIDVSKAAANQLGFLDLGVADVRIEVTGKNTGTQTGSTGPAANSAMEENEYYRVSVSRTNPTGFGVQIGSFRELVNLMRMTDDLKKSYRDEITIQVGVVNQVKVYRIIIGQKPNRDEAEKILQKLRKDYPDAFVYDFSL
jgi:rare lipoprotein A